MRVRIGAAGIIGALALLAPSSAQAEPYVGMGLGVTWLQHAPSIATDAMKLDARRIPEGDIATRGHLVMFGGHMDGGFTVSDRWIVPLFGIGLYGAVGSYDDVLTSYQGSIASLRPWSAYTADFLLPGFGVRSKHRRWMITGLVRTGASVVWEGGSISDGPGVTTFEGKAGTFLLAGQIEACRRLDPEQRLCLDFQPRLYEFGWLNGATIGLRYEIGR